MKRQMLGLALALSLTTTAKAQQTAKIEVAGVSLGRKLSAAQRDLFPVANHAGTRLMILLSLPGKAIVDVDLQNSKIEKFTDDKGTDLFGPRSEMSYAEEVMSPIRPQFSADGKSCGLTIESTGRPAKDASQIVFEANLQLRCGLLPRAEAPKMRMKKGAKLRFTQVPISISYVGPEGTGSTVHLQAQPFFGRKVSKITFLDAAGREIPTYFDDVNSLGNSILSSTFSLSSKTSTVTVKINYFSKIETVKLPVRVKTGLGF